MKRRDILIREKVESTSRSLEKWALKASILEPREQITFSIEIIKVPIVVSKELESILTLPLSEIFNREYCTPLGISKHTIGVLNRRLVQRGELSFGRWNESTKFVEVKIIGDLVSIPYDSFKPQKMGIVSRNAIRIVLKSLGIDW